MMTPLSIEELKTLIEEHAEPCVSIFMPTYRAGADTEQNAIRFKNMLQRAEERLTENGLRSPEARKLLEPAQKFLEDYDFWQHQSDGLAMFLAPEVFHHYRLPLHFDELIVVNDRFHVKPIFPLFSSDGMFYVLALSQNHVRLLQGTRHSVNEVDLEGVPKSLAEALAYDDPERQLQFHTRTAPARGGQRSAVFHGHGVGIDDEKDNILRYFHQVNKGVHQLLKNEHAPLVLAGVDYLLPIYREANTYPHLLENGLVGNPERLRADELHNQAWAIVEPHFQKAQHTAADRYRQLAKHQRASNDLKAIVPAASFGRVELLFVAVDLQRWGTFDPETQTVQLHPEAEPGDDDLLDFAAVHTLLNGGTVYAVKSEEVPDDEPRAPLVAVFRY